MRTEIYLIRPSVRLKLVSVKPSCWKHDCFDSPFGDIPRFESIRDDQHPEHWQQHINGVWRIYYGDSSLWLANVYFQQNSSVLQLHWDQLEGIAGSYCFNISKPDRLDSPSDIFQQNFFFKQFQSFQIYEKNLAHRLSLFIFFWNSRKLPSGMKNCKLKEPFRAVMITNPRKFVYRIYYNQASSLNDGTMKLVNWFDGNNLGLNSEPVLFHVRNIYENFNERVFIVPVVHVCRSSHTVSPSINLMNSDILSESSLDIHKLHQRQFNRRFYWPSSTVWKWLRQLVWSEREGRFIAEDSCSEDEF